MAVMDEFKEERATLKNKPLKDKIEYVMEYYKWPIIGVIAGIILVGSFIYTQVTSKEEALNGILLNANVFDSKFSEEDHASLTTDYLKELDLNSEKYTITLNTSSIYIVSDGTNVSIDPSYNYDSLMSILTQHAAGSLDFITGDTNTMIDLAYRDFFMDLSTVLTEEEYKTYEPYFLYIDYAIIERKSELDPDNTELFNTDYPDCRKPEAMEDPMPVLIDMSQSKTLQKIYNNPKEIIITMGINTPEQEENPAVQFLNYIFSK